MTVGGLLWHFIFFGILTSLWLLCWVGLARYCLVAPGSCIAWSFLACSVFGFLWDLAGLVVGVNFVLVGGAGFFGSMGRCVGVV
jgi:hypothetical protein